MPGLNERAWSLLQKACADMGRLEINPLRMECGCLVLDMGIQAQGGTTAGLAMAEIGMSGLGKSEIEMDVSYGSPWQSVVTRTSQPLEGCFLSQAAHWPIQVCGYRAMGSGPACLLNPDLGIAAKFGYDERSEHAVLILEAGRLPAEGVCRKLAEDCGIRADRLGILIAPTSSPAGRAQIAARSVETALHKLAHLGFDLHHVVRGIGKCPLAPDTGDDLTAMGLTNDMVIFGSQVWLDVQGVMDAVLADLVNALPAQASPSYGDTFLKTLQAAGGFYNIDPGLFAPAEITLTSLETGKVVRAGVVNPGRIAEIRGG